MLHKSTYNRLPDDESSVSKHVEDVRKLKIKILIYKSVFFVYIYNYIGKQGAKNIKSV
jgi:hypothetical protein